MLGAIVEPFEDVGKLPQRSGSDVARDLAGRMLLRYVDAGAIHEARGGRVGVPTWVTPTPYAVDEVSHYLDLPVPERLRSYVVRLDPAEIDVIAGPQWVGLGLGIQYYLPYGYEPRAVLPPQWAHAVR